MKSHATGEREIYKRKHVVDVNDTKMMVRTYKEHCDLRSCLNIVRNQKHISSAVEFGCGFGRMTQVLTEFTSDVFGVEREPQLVNEARQFIPEIEFINVNDLSSTGLPSDRFDLITTFTFLQHLASPTVKSVAQEILRCLRPGGYLVICEETDRSHIMGDPNNPNKICTVGRSPG